MALPQGKMILRKAFVPMVLLCAISCGGGPPPAPVRTPTGHADDVDASTTDVADAGPSPTIKPPQRKLVEFELERERTQEVLRRTPDGSWPAPEWARAGYWKKIDPALVPMGTYIRPKTVIVDVADDEKPGDQPATEDFDDCLSFFSMREGAGIRITSWHTDRDTCNLDEHRIVGMDGENLVVAISQSEVVVDSDTGEEVEDGPGCRLRIRVAPEEFIFEEDWPIGCSDWKCGLRGRLVGLSFPRIKVPTDCYEINDRIAARLVEAEYIGKRPDWAREAPDGEARALVKFGGAWRMNHQMPVWVADEAPESDDDWEKAWGDYPVTDKLDICPDDKHQTVAVVSTWAINEHSCYTEGRATMNTAGELMLVEMGPSSLWVDEIEDFTKGPPCHVRFVKKKGRLSISETWPPGCDSFNCGLRASLRGATFKRKRGEVGNCDGDE